MTRGGIGDRIAKHFERENSDAGKKSVRALWKEKGKRIVRTLKEDDDAKAKEFKSKGL